MKVPLSDSWKLLSPRVVALITTISKDGKINAAPYSFVGPISFKPPMVFVGMRKFQDTYKNTMETGEFVINIVSSEFAQEAIYCEEQLPFGVNELEKVGLNWFKSETVRPPRVKEAQIHLECRFKEEIDIGGSHVVVFGEVVSADAEALKKNYNPDFRKLTTIMHSSGEDFYAVGSEVRLKRIPK